MNQESKRGFSYGVFKPDLGLGEVKSFFERAMICLMYTPKGERAGFFYNYLSPISELDSTLSHQGLVVIYRNQGVNLITAPYAYANLLMRQFLQKDFYVSNISAVPLIVGAFTDIFDETWPSIEAKNVRHPPEGYVEAIRSLERNYIKPFFDGSSLDVKRFVLKSSIEKMGFNSNIRELPRHENLMHIILVTTWIDLTKGEDMVQIGRVTEATLPKLKRLSRDLKLIK